MSEQGSRCNAVVDGMHRAGVTHATICPGSRSTPLALAMDAHPGIEVHVHIDERGAAFHSLGMAIASGRPAAVLTTSGTAIANLLPAMVEAWQSNLPLIAVTADRPPEMRGRGANQTIDQHEIFGRYARWKELPDAAPAELAGRLAARLVRDCWRWPAGPGHLNVPLRKPLEPDQEDQQAWDFWQPHVGDAPPLPSLGDAEKAILPNLVQSGGKGLIVAGPSSAPDKLETGRRLHRLAQRLRVPLLADPLSGARYLRGSSAISCYDGLLENPPAGLEPDWILQTGRSPTSTYLRHWLGSQNAMRVHVDETGRGWDDIESPHWLLPVPLAPLLDTAEDSTAAALPAAPPDWSAAWQELEQATRTRLETELAADEEGRLVADFLGADAELLFVGNSLPVRNLDRYGWPRQDQDIHVCGNRGASGIDGTIATPAGMGRVARTVALIGDVAARHDASSMELLHDQVEVRVVENGGGRIFERLAVAQTLDHERMQRLFVTPAPPPRSRA